MPDTDHPRVPHLLDTAAAWSWRLIVIGALGYAALVVLGRLSVVVFPIYAAALLTVVLEPLGRRLRAIGAPPLLAAWGALLAFLAALTLAGLIVVPAVADEAGDLEETISEGIDDIEDWLVEDSPFDITRADADRFRADAADALERFFAENQEEVVSSAVLAFEFVAGTLLAIIATFFFVKDGGRMQTWALSQFRPTSRSTVSAVSARVWATLRGYMIGSASLGAIEAVIISTAVWLVGGALIVPIGVLTFVAAFVPLVGAITAGVVAVLATLVTAGVEEAVVVAVVALVVQQFDNDLLAPLVFGKALQLHPLVILFSVTGFAALFGLAGAFIGVPLVASAINGVGAYRKSVSALDAAPEATSPP